MHPCEHSVRHENVQMNVYVKELSNDKTNIQLTDWGWLLMQEEYPLVSHDSPNTAFRGSRGSRDWREAGKGCKMVSKTLGTSLHLGKPVYKCRPLYQEVGWQKPKIWSPFRRWRSVAGPRGEGCCLHTQHSCTAEGARWLSLEEMYNV